MTTQFDEEVREFLEDLRHGPTAGANGFKYVQWVSKQSTKFANLQDKFDRLGIYGRTIERLYDGFYDGTPRNTAELLALSDEEMYRLASKRYG